MVQPKQADRRSSLRFDKAFPVRVKYASFAETTAIARNISAGGMWIEMPFQIPLGAELEVRFEMPDCPGAIRVSAQVKNHYAFNYGGTGPGSSRGMGVRFREFLEDSGDRLRMSLRCFRTLH